MNIPQWCIDHLFIVLVKELSCPSLPMSCNDPREWAWDVKDTDIQFIVRAEDKIFRVETYEGEILRRYDDSDDPEKVIQAAKGFKSKYLSDS